MHENHEYHSATTQKSVISGEDTLKIVLVSSGAFNPPTLMHFRMFERAKDFFERTLGLEVLEGIVSPCSDYNATPDLVASNHRLKMLQLITSRIDWISVDGWESEQSKHCPVLEVLRNVQSKMRKKHGAGNIRVMLLCGGDVMESFAKISPDVDAWRTNDLTEVVRNHGIVVISRMNTNPLRVVYMIDLLREFQKNIYVIEDETFASAMCSTKLRTAIRRSESIRFCTDDQVISYISKFGLYLPEKSLESTAETKLALPLSSGPGASPHDSVKERHTDVQRNLPSRLEKKISNEPVWCGQASTSHLPLSSRESECTQTTITLESPIYDNVSFEEIVKASNSWKEYIKSVAAQTSSSVLEQIKLLEEQHSPHNEESQRPRPKLSQDRGTQYEIPSSLSRREQAVDAKKLIRFDIRNDKSERARKPEDGREKTVLSPTSIVHSLTSTASRCASPRQFGTPSDSGITLTYADCPLDSNTPETTV
ncbi:hypothetical protein QR680_001904 [Steinernema hermaphroditum]|uniref:Cytidyltransferase-like domain-containing protein n=1 Tax=Steinernema hermaphroditum TaxID=289476 RepID=A0AA39LGZ3_9BILA|nr:hypothetical protein QR680_001904 [Steinernema hermaphroditum]